MSWNKNRSRNVRKAITFTPEEWKEINAVYHRVKPGKRYRSFNEFVRDLLFHGVAVTVTVPIKPDDASRQIKKIGGNINQIAKILNASGGASQSQIEEIISLMKQLNTLVNAFQDEVAVRIDGVR